MKIITVPHPTLRQVAQPVTVVDKKLLQFLDQLSDTLRKKDNPRGVGLAAPQVDQAVRAFATFLHPVDGPEKSSPEIRIFINPEIKDRSEEITFGPNPDEPILEGCLSIPEIYGPVPSFQCVDLAFQELVGNELVDRRERFEEYRARVIQHENDHLNGRLFIDYTVQFDLPLYREHGKKFEEMTPEMINAFHHQTLAKK
jgi:peptide deformylase